jgi:hypothetical protein
MVRKFLTVLGMAMLCQAGSAIAAPCAGFTDLDSTSQFCDEVTWMKNRGITMGCTATQYCPQQDVTRLQMALFMFRLGDALFPSTCAAGQVMKWNGAAWACAADATAGGGGTVSSVTAGTGLTGGTITSSGTIAVNTAYVQRRVSTSCAAGSSIRAIAADGSVTCETDDAGPANAFVQGGNAFGGAARLGTNDNQPVEIEANGALAMRIEPHAISPNVTHGYTNASYVATGVYGASIGGGGTPGSEYAGRSCVPFLGCQNTVLDHFGTIGGGAGNVAGFNLADPTDAHFGTVGGGFLNVATRYATVAGGLENQATGDLSSIGGGWGNTASAFTATVPGGLSNEATGSFSTAFGNNSIAGGDGSVAMGFGAEALHNGSFVFADGSGLFNPVNTGSPNQFIARALGGVYFFTAGTDNATYTGAYLGPGASAWAIYSDQEGKHDIAAVDPEEVLRRVTAMQVSTWQWKSEAGSVRHMGPTAQAFHAAFGLGPSDKHIVTVDADGVALAAIQGLNAKVVREIAELKAELTELRTLRDEVERMRADLRR